MYKYKPSAPKHSGMKGRFPAMIIGGGKPAEFSNEPTQQHGDAMALGLNLLAVESKFRALRLWHWGTALTLREKAKSLRGMEQTELSKKADSAADWHLSQVQLLNIMFPIDDTAEKDAMK